MLRVVVFNTVCRHFLRCDMFRDRAPASLTCTTFPCYGYSDRSSLSDLKTTANT